MKLFKRIYYPIISVLMLVMLVFSILDATGGYNTSKLNIEKANGIIATVSEKQHSVDDRTQKDEVRDYIKTTLNGYGVKEAVDDKNSAGKNIADYARSDSGKIIPTFVVQRADLKFADVSEFYSKNKLGTPVVRDYNVNNIVVSLPGKASTADVRAKETLMFVCHYDSFSESLGATDTGLNVANMLLNIEAALDEEFENDLVFIFCDYGNENSLGAFAFRNNFIGLNNLAADVDMVVSLENMGTGGSLVLYDTNNTDFDFVKTYGKINNSTYVNSMFKDIYKDRFTAADVFGSAVSVSFANIGQGENYKTRNDTVNNVSKTVLAQSMDITYKMIREYGNASISDVRTDKEGVYFSYLNIMTVSYPVWVAYLFAGIMLLLIGAIAVLNFKFKNYSFKNTLIGALISLLGAVGALAGLFIGYYIIGALAAGFGVLSFKGVPYITFSNTGIVIGAMLLAAACAIACYTFFKWLLKVKARDVVNGNILLVSLVAVILSFAVPKVSMFFSVLAIFELITLLIVNIFRTKFKAKTGMDIDRLFLPVIGMILSAPVVITGLFMLANVYGAAMYPLFIGMFPLYIGMIAPYFSFLNPVFQKIADRLPQRKVRKYEIITEEVAHPTKKGKMIEQTVRHNFEEKEPRKYKSAVGISMLAIVSILVVIFSSMFGSNISKNLTYAHGNIDAVYDDTLVYSVKATHSGGTFSTSTGDWVIKDRDAYSRLVFSGFSYDRTEGVYYREDTDNRHVIKNLGVYSSVAGNTRTITVNPIHGSSRYTLRFDGATAIKKIKVTQGDNSYTKEFDSQNEITITSTSNTTFEIEGTSLYGGSMLYTEVARGSAVFGNFSPDIRDAIDGKNVAFRMECAITL